MINKSVDLSQISEEKLLDKRVCDLPLSIEDSWLKNCVETLYHELDEKDIKFKPLCYLADEWLIPDGEPVIGIPFFLAHPSLIKLEKKIILEVEGGTKQWCMKLLRHETGHAINYAYKLHRRKKWQEMFGSFFKEYEDTYRFRPYSKNFVRHLENYYAQYHPDEDFAETFAVWLTPELNWQEQYSGWKALAKLNYLDQLMKEIKNKVPLCKNGKKHWQAKNIRSTLKNFYKKKRKFYAEEFPDFHDANLKRIFSFSESTKNKDLISAQGTIKKYKKNILNNIARWTGEKKYIINDLLDTLIKRCYQLQLMTDREEFLVMLDVSSYVNTLVMNYLHTGGFGK